MFFGKGSIKFASVLVSISFPIFILGLYEQYDSDTLTVLKEIIIDVGIYLSVVLIIPIITVFVFIKISELSIDADNSKDNNENKNNDSDT